MLNYKFILKILGLLIAAEGLLMLIPLAVSLATGGTDSRAFLISILITTISGAIIFLLFRKGKRNITKREGYVFITALFIFFSLFGALPFYFSDFKFSITDSFFEAMSGFTTTGATIINEIEQMPQGLLFWRSFTQWIGGMGIIFLSLSILPLFGIIGTSLFPTENPDASVERMNPKIKNTAIIVISIYLILTALETILLTVGGMSLFDSICHSFSTISTGGFSTSSKSIGNWNSPFIEYVVIFFMILAGTNFTLIFFALKGSFKKLFKNEEFKYYLAFIISFTLIIGLGLLFTTNSSFEHSFRTSLFQVTSFISTTGFVTDNYIIWNQLIFIIFFLLLFIGGTSGSAAGGMKIGRIVIIIKSCHTELLRLLHPNAIIPIKCNNRSMSSSFISSIQVFSISYFVVFIISNLVLMISGSDYMSAIGASAACLSNIGPGIGIVGPFESYSLFSPLAKWFLTFVMLLGRLEIFIIISMFFPIFWKR